MTEEQPAHEGDEQHYHRDAAVGVEQAADGIQARAFSRTAATPRFAAVITSQRRM